MVVCVFFFFFLIFFFKQKTAYEIKECDWSSDVCSSDLGFVAAMHELAENEKMNVCFCTHKLSVFAGAIGTAIWGAFRHVKLREQSIQSSEEKGG